ncbi:MAG: MerR family transcriptional regulator [Pseudomonadota bacterium]|nr:MerR family transcriptional regulator [Pseudomonadota bacterium]
MRASDEADTAIPISAVERETGLSKDTLRMWERRYGFPAPGRDPFGDRLYPRPQVDKLRLIRRLMDQGFRPGRIIGESYQTLVALAGTRPAQQAPEAQEQDAVRELLALVKAHRVAELQAALQQCIQDQGLRRFVLDLASPLAHAVGEAWFHGELAVFEEHLFTEVVQNLLRKWIGEARNASGQRPPRILLTTFPNELHALGLLMAEALMTMDGAECLSFGLQLPVADIIQAALAHRVDVVTVALSPAYPRTATNEGLSELRGALPAAIEVWAGGGGVMRLKRVPEGVVVVSALADVSAAIRHWRQQPGRAGAGPA